MIFDRKAPIKFFQSAALNQYTFDELYYNLLGIEINDYKGIPRPAKWAVKYKKFIPYVKRASSCILFFWIYIGFYINLFRQFFVFAFIRGGVSLDGYKNAAIGIVVCERSFQVLARKEIGLIEVWLCANYDIPIKENQGVKKISVKSILNFKELVECVVLSIHAHIQITKYKKNYLSFQSYAAMSWMMTWYSLIKLTPSEIYTSEHHDRWAVLFDSYVGLTRTQKKCGFNLVQHGNEYEQTYAKIETISIDKGLPYRLKNINKLYLYNKKQLDIFNENILSKSMWMTSDVNYIGTNLCLVDLNLEMRSVLIVGHSFCEMMHINLYEEILKFKKVKVFYKPHPTVAASNNAKSLAWAFIDDNNFYPRVDLVISYPSTLVDEYEGEGIKVIVHEFNNYSAIDLNGKINSVLSVWGVN